MTAVKEVGSTYSNREDQITQVALDLFSKNGYDRVTVKQVATACDISEPAVYRYFESKEALFDAVLDALITNWDYENLFDRLKSERDVEQLLSELAMHIVNAYCINEKSCRLLLYSALGQKQKASLVYDTIRGSYVRFLTAQLDQLYQEGLIIERNNTITARCFVGMVIECAMGFSLWKDMQGEMFPAEQVVANNVPIYARGLKKQ